MATSSWQTTFVFYDTNISTLFFTVPMHTYATEIRTDTQTVTTCYFIFFDSGHAQNTMDAGTRVPAGNRSSGTRVQNLYPSQPYYLPRLHKIRVQLYLPSAYLFCTYLPTNPRIQQPIYYLPNHYLPSIQLTNIHTYTYLPTYTYLLFYLLNSPSLPYITLHIVIPTYLKVR